MPWRERRLILGLMAALALAASMFAQDRDMRPGSPYTGTLQARVSTLQGNITNDEGQPLAAITVEVSRVLQQPQFSDAPTQSWHVRTDQSGDFKIQVPSPGEYIVSASQVDVGTDAIRVTVEIDRPATANLRLWNPGPVSAEQCGASDTSFREMTLPADENPALVHLTRWLQAVERHIPGCNDSFAREANTFSLDELETLVGDLMNLQTATLIWSGGAPAPQFLRDSMGEREASAFLQKAKANWPNAVEVTSHITLRSSTESVRRRTRESRARIGADRIQLYNRWFTRVEIASMFRGNDTVLRGAMFHSDLALFGGADPDQRGSRFHLVEDGGRRGGGYASGVRRPILEDRRRRGVHSGAAGRRVDVRTQRAHQTAPRADV